MGRFAHLGAYGFEGARDVEVARNAMRATEVEHLRARSILELSGGETQRVIIARALAQEARILLLDEPTAGINPTLIKGLIERLKRSNADLGITLFVIEHNMRAIMSLAEHIYCLAHGQLLTGGPPEQIQTDQQVIDAYLGAR